MKLSIIKTLASAGFILFMLVSVNFISQYLALSEVYLHAGILYAMFLDLLFSKKDN